MASKFYSHFPAMLCQNNKLYFCDCYLFKRVNSAESKLGFYYFTAFFFSFYRCPAVGLFERMYPWCYHVQSSDIAEKPTKIASDDDPEYLPDTFSTLLSLVSSAKIFQVIVEILLQCFSAQYTINTEFFIWNKVFDDKLFFTKSGLNLNKEKPNLKVSFSPHVSA